MKVIILGAGKGFVGLNEKSGHPKAIHEIAKGKRVLDILIENFQNAGIEEFIFVGGYQVEKIINAYPNIKHYFNPNWESTNILKSLYLSKEELKGEVLISYADTLYSTEVISDLIESKGNIRLSEDKNWLNRYEGRGLQLINSAEKLVSQDKKLLDVGVNHISAEEASGEFTGLIYLNNRGATIFKDSLDRYMQTDESFIANENIVRFIKRLMEDDHVIHTCATEGAWAELEAPQDVAQFVFGTKAETLDRLHKRLVKSKIEDQVSFTLEKWKTSRDTCLDQIQGVFQAGEVVVRSSAIGEDSFESSNAGEFLSLLNVNVTDRVDVLDSVNSVFNSYHNTNPRHQCLIQPQLENVLMSGVIFTRDLETGAPYYIINYDISEKTDTITSGTSTTSKTIVYYKNSTIQFEDPFFNQLIEVLKELEQVVGHDSLDIEFAQTAEGIHILQVRPIVANRKNRVIADEGFDQEIKAVRKAVQFYCTNNQLGVTGGVLANMPDWNPAEIIGVAPKPLALTMYQYLITDEIWRIQRRDYGYRNSFPLPLVISLSGQPYINSKGSFNSFIPASLREETAIKLLEYYLAKLANNPHLHDKVEFDIAYTCFSFDLRERLEELKNYDFSEVEIEEVFESLRLQSKDLISPEKRYIENSLNQIEELKNKKRAVLDQDIGVLQKSNLVYELLEECKEYGTLPFAKLARSAFIATDILKSLQRLNILSKKDYDTFFNSLETVASYFSQSLDKMRANEMNLEEFLSLFGHLRPGTYDITSKRYDEAPEVYFPKKEIQQVGIEKHPSFELSKTQYQQIEELIKEHDLEIGVDDLFKFIELAIVNRESSKFEFTKNLSDSFVLISEIGEAIGLSKEDLSYVPINFFTDMTKSFQGVPTLKAEIGGIIKRNKFKYRLTHSLKLPHLLKDERDVELFWLEDGKPNFITEKNITNKVVYLRPDEQNQVSISDRIILIDNADPGYDWIFGHKIKGLITVYGGANSHMAIRAAEFGLPAAIGCGEKIGKKLKKATTIELNCANRTIQVIS